MAAGPEAHLVLARIRHRPATFPSLALRLVLSVVLALAGVIVPWATVTFVIKSLYPPFDPFVNGMYGP